MFGRNFLWPKRKNFLVRLLNNLTKNLSKNKKETYYKCTHCGDEIFWNTNKRLVSCRCGKIYVDGCEFYVRIGGDEKDYKVIKKIHGK